MSCSAQVTDWYTKAKDTLHLSNLPGGDEFSVAPWLICARRRRFSLANRLVCEGVGRRSRLHDLARLLRLLRLEVGLSVGVELVDLDLHLLGKALPVLITQEDPVLQVRVVDHAVGDVERLVGLEVVVKLDHLVVLVRRLVRPLLPLVSELEVEGNGLAVGADGLLAVEDLDAEAVVLLEELVAQEGLDRRPLLLHLRDALHDDVEHGRVVHLLEALGEHAVNDLLVDLRGPRALGVGVLGRRHLEHAHPEGVDVDALVVLLVVHLGRHELRRADDGLGERLVPEGGEAQVADLDRARGACDEDVVALEVPVDDGRGARVEEVEPLEDLPAPRVEHAPVDPAEAPQVLPQRAGRHELADEDKVLLREAAARLANGGLPVVEEPDEVGVLQPLQHLRLLPEAVALLLGELLVLQLAPRHVRPVDGVEPLVDGLEAAATELVELEEALVGAGVEGLVVVVVAVVVLVVLLGAHELEASRERAVVLLPIVLVFRRRRGRRLAILVLGRHLFGSLGRKSNDGHMSTTCKFDLRNKTK